MSSPHTAHPIAIGGCGSSGTSLLRRILDSHSEIACGKEMSVFDRPALYDLTVKELREMYERQDFDRLDADMAFPITLEGNRTYCGLLRGNHGDSYNGVAETLALFADAENLADFWNRYFTHWARKQGKQRWAEKTPGNIFCADKFLELYPDGRFIHMIRDGRDACLSLIYRRDFYPHTALMRWIASMEAGLAVRGHERVYEVRYEELVHAPEQTLRRLFSWLQIDYEGGVLDFHERETDNRFGYASSPIHGRSAGRWERQKDEIPATLRRMMNIGLRRHLKLMDYE